MTNATATESPVLPGGGQLCSTKGCGNPAAFKTRTKPSWCLDCIDGILLEGALRSDEPFTKPNAYRLTTCVDCGVQAHYKLAYTVEKNALGEKTCRACYWRGWAKVARAGLGRMAPEPLYSRGDIEEHCNLNGLDLIALTTDINDGDDPIITRCRSCEKISAERMGDIGWGCTCTRNARSTTPAFASSPTLDTGSAKSGTPRSPQNLLADSADPSLVWWDHDRNDETTFRTMKLRARRECWWKCPVCSHSFQAKVLDMTGGRPACPQCKALREEEWDREHAKWRITPVAEVPELATAWADDANPRAVMVAGDWQLRRFQCPAGHHPRMRPLAFLESGCPSCRAAQTRKAQKNWLANTLPEITSQWHPTRNGKLTPESIVWDSQRNVWWLADCCGYEWQESPRSRDKYDRLRCPQCLTILDSLAWQDPGLAAEWSPANPRSAWQVRPTATTPFVPEWICATNPEHVWNSTLASRTNGSECPECKVAGKSKVELDHYAAAKEFFTRVRSGALVRDSAFSTRPTWTVDISAAAGSTKFAIEYDGAYWHRAAAKVLVDERKSADLLAAGYAVVRLREDDLPELPIQHPRYREIRVYSAAPRPREVLQEIQAWLDQLPSAKGAGLNRHITPAEKPAIMDQEVPAIPKAPETPG